MYIKELVEKLNHFKEAYGNIPVMIIDRDGKYLSVSDIELDSSDTRETAILIIK